MIEQSLWVKIHQNMPILCLDVIVVKDHKVLLVKRDKEPAKNYWWFPGGRLQRDEEFKDAAHRLLRVETGLSASRFKQLGLTNMVFKEDPFGHGKGTHTPTIIMQAETCFGEVEVDKNHTGFIWWDGKNPPGKLHPHVSRWAATVLKKSTKND